MKLDFEYGQGLMSANLPDNTDVFIPGTTYPDPQCLPQDWDTLYNIGFNSSSYWNAYLNRACS